MTGQQTIPLDRFVTGPVQPASRTEARALQELEAAIRLTNHIVPPHVIPHAYDGTFILVDGHRRVAVARKLGYTTLTSTVHPVGTDPESLFAALSRGTRAISGREKLTAWALATNRENFLNHCTVNTQQQINDLVMCLGLARTVELGLSGSQAPYLATTIRQVETCLRYYRGSIPIVPPSRAIGEWLITHQQQLRIRGLLTAQHGNIVTSATAGKLYRAITKNQPL